MQERQISSSLEENDEEYASILHKELLQISNKSLANRNRFHDAVEPNAYENKNTKHQSNDFLQVTKEKSMFNQYWYSEHTIQVLVEAIDELCKNYGNNREQRIAFLSTPSLYFALPQEKREHCKLFEYDHEWANDKGFVHFDFNAPTNIHDSLKGKFDIAIIDPPFITRDVWEMYASATKYLLKNDPKEKGIVIGTTVQENEECMMELFHATPTVFKPMVTNLVYQYSIFINCPSAVLSVPNQEIEQD